MASEKGTTKLINSTEKFFEKVAQRLDDHEIEDDLSETIQLAELAKNCMQIIKLSKEDKKKNPDDGGYTPSRSFLDETANSKNHR